MSEQSTSWHDVSERVESLADRLKTQLGEKTDKEEVKTALHDLRAAVDTAFKAAGDALKDEGVRDDLKAVGSTLGDAISTTFAKVGSEVQNLFDRRPAPPTGDDPTGAATDEPDAPASEPIPLATHEANEAQSANPSPS